MVSAWTATRSFGRMEAGSRLPLSQCVPTVPQDLDRINAVVKECLARCYVSPDRPAYEVGAYLTELRKAGWGDTDVSLIRATVAKFLRELAGDLENVEPE